MKLFAAAYFFRVAATLRRKRVNLKKILIMRQQASLPLKPHKTGISGEPLVIVMTLMIKSVLSDPPKTNDLRRCRLLLIK